MPGSEASVGVLIRAVCEGIEPLNTPAGVRVIKFRNRLEARSTTLIKVISRRCTSR